MILTRLKDLFLHILLPRTCFACKADLSFAVHQPLCPECETALEVPGPLFCHRCGVPLKDGGAHCYQCRASKAGSFKCKIIRSAILFNPVSRPLIHAFKYSGYTHLSGYLGAVMRTHFKEHPELSEADILVPVPLYPKKLRQRGYNQSLLLALAFGKEIGLPVDTVSLLRQRDTPSQTHLNRAGRLLNISGAFICSSPEKVKGKVVLLIDDVATTGATLEGCAEALKNAGAKRVMAYTLAREP